MKNVKEFEGFLWDDPNWNESPKRDKTNIYLEASDLVSILTYQKSMDSYNKHSISINDSVVEFNFLGVEGYVESADFEKKRLYLKVDPDHQDKNQQYVWKSIEKFNKFIGNWVVYWILT